MGWLRFYAPFKKSYVILLIIIVSFDGGDCLLRRRRSVPSQADMRTDIEYKTLYYSQQVDHFSFSNQDSFNQRYLVADQFWDPKNGPIFFYTGNEGDITWFCNNTGIMWDWAPQFKAMLIFAEHRYYGKSLPYGKDSYSDLSKLGYLSAEQALADFSTLLTNVRNTVPQASNKPVIAFGGSYGGMLAAWFRMKYPHIIEGALAGSAPIWMFGDLVPCEAFYQKVTDDFKREGENCATNIAKSWSVITEKGKTASGRLSLSSIFHLCDDLKTEADVSVLKSWLAETYTNLAMVDYPYAASFLEPLPAWPIKAVCQPLLDADPADLLGSISRGVLVYYNYSGSAQCLDILQQATQDLGDKGWDFQACTEMVMPSCANGQTDMFEPSPWDYEQFAADCKKQWGTIPRPNWIIEQFGGKNITAASNIIFSNGDLDPWSVGGVLKTLSPSLVAIQIADGAHHLDLRSDNPDDPPSVTIARQQELNIIKTWINQYWDLQDSSESDLTLWPSVYLYKTSLFGQDDFTGRESFDGEDSVSILIAVTLLFTIGAAVLFVYLGLAQNIQAHMQRRRQAVSIEAYLLRKPHDNHDDDMLNA